VRFADSVRGTDGEIVRCLSVAKSSFYLPKCVTRCSDKKQRTARATAWMLDQRSPRISSFDGRDDAAPVGLSRCRAKRLLRARSRGWHSRLAISLCDPVFNGYPIDGLTARGRARRYDLQAPDPGVAICRPFLAIAVVVNRRAFDPPAFCRPVLVLLILLKGPETSLHVKPPLL
jgi:hypothetical protein